MFTISKSGNDYNIHPKGHDVVLEQFDNQAEVVARFNLMMMTTALDHSQVYHGASVVQFERDVFVVANLIGDTVFNIISPIFDKEFDANEFLETTVCDCGFGIAQFEPYSGGLVCEICIRELEGCR